MITNEAERKQVASDLYEKMTNTMSYLHDHWLDEHEYEDISLYAEKIQEALKEYDITETIRMTERPFGFILTLGKDDYKATYAYFITEDEYVYKRIL